MAAICHLEFSKFRVDVMWSLLPCYSGSLCKISLKLDNRLLSYGKKRCLKWQPSAIMNFKNFHIGYITVTEFEICCCVPNFIKII